jgi:hypothetical protein
VSSLDREGEFGDGGGDVRFEVPSAAASDRIVVTLLGTSFVDAKTPYCYGPSRRPGTVGLK